MATRVALSQAGAALSSSLRGMMLRIQECERPARVALLSEAVNEPLLQWLLSRVRNDGGWSDVPETGWCLGLLKCYPAAAELQAGLDWLRSQRLPGGGWGRTARDVPRIPVTALALRFLGQQIGTEADWRCIERLWREDLAAEVQLTYKGGFYLLCQEGNPRPSVDLIRATVDFLARSQNDDGGFGPWKGHPIGSDPWSTGICLVGLCSHHGIADRRVIQRAADWLCHTQLPSGLWAYHFIDEGSAYAYWGLKEAIRVVEGE